MPRSPAPSHTAYTLPLCDLRTFLGAVLKSGSDLIAPVKTDAVRFASVHDPRTINLKEQAYVPAKGFFFKEHEPIFTYEGGVIKKPKAKKAHERVFFGLRRCDLAAIARQDVVFLHGKHIDPSYAEARRGSILIGYHCSGPLTPWCFCGSMNLEDFYDLMFWKMGRKYRVHVGSEVGRKFIEKYRKYFAPCDFAPEDGDRTVPDTQRIVKRDLAAFYDDPLWEEGAVECLSCAACTTLCPTCFCSEHHDEPSITNPGSGKRTRTWSSCQLPAFTRVAGDHIFRQKRLERFKHRIYHQLQYFRERNGIDLCTGCGRCITSCPTRIDFLSIINKLKKPSTLQIPLSIVRERDSSVTHSWLATCHGEVPPWQRGATNHDVAPSMPDTSHRSHLRVTSSSVPSTKQSNPELIPHPVKVLERIEESHDTVTLRLDSKIPYRPGQFFQLSLPGIGESPISISSYSEEHIDFSIRIVGNVTRALAKKKPGETVFLRGPYGNGYPLQELKGGNLIFIGGGCGVAPLKGAIDYTEHHRDAFGSVHLLLGFRSPKDVIFEHALKRWGETYTVSVTVDAAPPESCYTGTIGFVTEELKKLKITDPEKTYVLMCGPPAMMKSCSAMLKAQGITSSHILVSAERLMHCAIGTCCHCMIRGTYVCLDGPVFTEEELSRMPND